MYSSILLDQLIKIIPLYLVVKFISKFVTEQFFSLVRLFDAGFCKSRYMEIM